MPFLRALAALSVLVGLISANASDSSTFSNLSDSVKYQAKRLRQDPNLSKDLRDRSLQHLRGLGQVSPQPLLISNNDYRFISQQMDLIVRALSAFHRDHFSGEKSYQTSGLLPPQLMNVLMQDYLYHETGNHPFARERRYIRREAARPEDIRQIPSRAATIYGGPDIAITPEGYKIMELGIAMNLGGIGSMDKAREALMRPEYGFQGLLGAQYDPAAFAESLFEYAHRPAKKYEGEAIFIMTARNDFDVNSRRGVDNVKEVMTAAGFKVVTLAEGISQSRSTRNKPSHIPVEMDDGAYLVAPDGEMTKVGYVLSYVQTLALRKLDWAEPLIQADRRGQLEIALSTGADILADKRLLPYLADLVMFYTGQPLRLRPPESHLLYDFDNETVDRKRLREVFERPQDWVIKTGNQAGALGVWLGTELSAAHPTPAQLDLEQMILRSPQRFMVQRLVDVGTQGDLRFIIAGSEQGETYISPTAWSRATTPGTTSNFSGRYVESTMHAVFVEQGLGVWNRCTRAFSGR